MSSDTAARIAELKADIVTTRDAINRIVSGGQAYSAEGRAMTRGDLATLREHLKELRRDLAELEGGRTTRVYGVVYR